MDSKFLLTPEYSFLKENKYLNSNMILLTAGGSYAYGTNHEGSDIDLRGVTNQQKSDLIGRTNFEHYIDSNTDTTIYAFNKFIKLASEGNPNVLEILGCREEDIFYASDIGAELLDNVDMFVSKLIAKKIAGFATSQLRRIQTVLARHGNQYTQEDYVLHACERAMKGFNERYSTLCNSSDIHLALELVGDEYKICATGTFNHVPIQELNGAYNDLTNIRKSFHKLTGCNSKKDSEHLNKHAYHLVRLLCMGKEILEDGIIRTYRDKEHDTLMSMRNGEWMTEDGGFKPEFFEFVDSLEQDFHNAEINSSIPKLPDNKRIDDFVMKVNMKVL